MPPTWGRWVQSRYQANKATQMSFSTEENTRSLFQEQQNTFIVITLVCVLKACFYLITKHKCILLTKWSINFTQNSCPFTSASCKHTWLSTAHQWILILGFLLHSNGCLILLKIWTALRVLSHRSALQCSIRGDEYHLVGRGVSFYTPITKRLYTMAENNLVSGDPSTLVLLLLWNRLHW